MGADIAPQPLAPDETEGFEVMPSAWDAVCAFLACETQWRAAAGMAGLIWLGLDYPGVSIVLERLNCADTVFADLQVMEQAALEVFGEASS